MLLLVVDIGLCQFFRSFLGIRGKVLEEIIMGWQDFFAFGLVLVSGFGQVSVVVKNMVFKVGC